MVRIRPLTSDSAVAPVDQHRAPCSVPFRRTAMGVDSGRPVGLKLPLMCRFSDAGVQKPFTRSGAGVGKAPRHEIAGRWGTGGAAGAMGIWPRRESRGWSEDVDAVALPARMSARLGVNERTTGSR